MLTVAVAGAVSAYAGGSDFDTVTALFPLAAVGDHLDDFRGDGATYVICQAGGRSRRACELVELVGIEAVNVAGGTGAWIASGRDTVPGDRPT